MISYSEVKDIPSIGQVVHFWPRPKEKLAAIVIEVHPMDRDEGQQLIRPKIDLQVFHTNGKIVHKIEIDPLNIADTEEGSTFKDVWCFVNEFATLQTEDINDEEMVGTKSNVHVGMDMGE